MVAITTQPTRVLPIGIFTGPARRPMLTVKYVVDMIGALVLLLAFSPVLLAAALAVRLDGGPVFFRQTRIGRNGQTFRMTKFRSMVVNAEAVKHLLAADNEAEGPLFKMRHDPRITRVGRFLRKYSIDELPQLFNVLTGTMSLIGPRPHLPAEVETYSSLARRRLAVRPGLTGLWQVSGRSDLAWDDAIRLDLRYVDEWSMRMDASIVFRTVGAVLAGKGAY